MTAEVRTKLVLPEPGRIILYTGSRQRPDTANRFAKEHNAHHVINDKTDAHPEIVKLFGRDRVARTRAPTILQHRHGHEEDLESEILTEEVA